jgi:HAD superfamily hydrolase (TIGR01458 family)
VVVCDPEYERLAPLEQTHAWLLPSDTLRMMPHMPTPDPGLRAALHGVRALLLDLDGVLILKGAAVPGAVEALAELDLRQFPYLVVTNTSLVSRATLARWGRSVGFSLPADRFQSALSASAAMVRREYGDRPVYVITSDDARVEFEGVNVVDGEAADVAPGDVAAVVLGDSPDQLTKANLDRAFRLVRGGAALIGMHRNAWWLTPEGPTLDAGAFLVGLEYATERKARIVGKPAAASFRLGLERLAAEARDRGEPRLLRREVAMVGDDVNSDVGGAQRVGLRGVFVRTGKHGDNELAAAAARARGAVVPDAVAPSIAEVVAALD